MRRLFSSPTLARLSRRRVALAAGLALLCASALVAHVWYQPDPAYQIPKDYAGIDARHSHPARAHCQAHHDAGARKSGLYRVDAGLLMREASVWCEMSPNEGLTLLLRGRNPATVDWNTGDGLMDPASPPHPELDQNYKLPDQVINQLATGGAFFIVLKRRGISAVVAGCRYNHTGSSSCQPTRCQHNAQHKLVTFFSRGGRQTQLSVCRMDRQGIEIEYWQPAQNPLSSTHRVFPVLATNDYAGPSGSQKHWWFKTRLWWAERRCDMAVGSPKPTDPLRKRLDWARCLNDRRPQDGSRYNYLTVNDRITMYARHPSAKAAASLSPTPSPMATPSPMPSPTSETSE